MESIEMMVFTLLYLFLILVNYVVYNSPMLKIMGKYVKVKGVWYLMTGIFSTIPGDEEVASQTKK